MMYRNENNWLLQVSNYREPPYLKWVKEDCSLAWQSQALWKRLRFFCWEGTTLDFAPSYGNYQEWKKEENGGKLREDTDSYRGEGRAE